MDRFIVKGFTVTVNNFIDLKSNMDRFIALPLRQDKVLYLYLKSNMDRFIAGVPDICLPVARGFKIQYG